MLKFLKKVKCKIFACCGSKCSLNDGDLEVDIDNDGIVDFKADLNKLDKI